MEKKIFLFVTLFAISISAQENRTPNGTQLNQLQVQAITVTIGGNFIVTGSFPASRYQRLDYFITSIYNVAEKNALGSLTQLETIRQVSEEISKYPFRNIKLKHANGEVEFIDLLKFRFTGDFKDNPYLQNDDIIIFPAYDSEKNIIEIVGAVNQETKFQYVEGDKLSDAILFAGGVNTDAYSNITTAEISRLDNTGNNEELIKINIKDDFPLKASDRIKILSDENQKKNYKILILGEVKYPGYIYVTKDGSTISDVISKAGGFNPNADLMRAEVVRDYNSLEMLRKYQLTKDYTKSPDQILLPETKLTLKQKKETLEMIRLSNLVDEDTLFFNIDNQLRMLRTESLVDFTKLNDPTSDENKFLVKDGDVIIVPDRFDYVYVFGQVAKAGYVKYNPGNNYKYYIEKAGGKTEEAKDDDDEVVVIKGKEKNWISEQKEKLKLEPGDYIYVPKDIPRTTWFYIARTGTVVGIIGSVATIILLLTQFGK